MLKSLITDLRSYNKKITTYLTKLKTRWPPEFQTSLQNETTITEEKRTEIHDLNCCYNNNSFTRERIEAVERREIHQWLNTLEITQMVTTTELKAKYFHLEKQSGSTRIRAATQFVAVQEWRYRPRLTDVSIIPTNFSKDFVSTNSDTRPVGGLLCIRVCTSDRYCWAQSGAPAS